MITKAEALDNLARAYFAEKIEWKIFMAGGNNNGAYGKASVKYETLRSAYLDCDIVEWDDIDSSWWNGVKLEKPIE